MNIVIILILSIVFSSITACSPSNTTQEKKHQFSQYNKLDIKSDLDILQTISTAEIQQDTKSNEGDSQLTDSENEKYRQRAIQNMRLFVHQFNNQLTNAQIKSSEVNQLRKDLIDANRIGLELSEEGIRTQPNEEKINQLQAKAQSIQNDIQDQMQQLINQINDPTP